MNYFYVICPVGADKDFARKRQILEEVGQTVNMKAFFPMEQHIEFSIEITRSELRKAKLVVADLSHERPSCYFELGVAQALLAPIFVLASKGTQIHQIAESLSVSWFSDLKQYRHLVTKSLVSVRC